MIEDVHLTCIIVGIVQGIYTDVIKWIFYQIKFDRHDWGHMLSLSLSR